MPQEKKTPKATVEDASDTEDTENLKGKAQELASPGDNSEDSKEGTPASAREEEEDDEEEGQKEGSGGATTADASSNPWQAIWSPQYNAYYFYNPETQQTTWENPLASGGESSSTTAPTTAPDPEQSKTEEGSSSESAYSSQYTALQDAALAAGIDPALAHLDPSLTASIGGAGGASGSGLPPAFTAKFNARTGQFTRPDGRDPTHLSEHARAQRMSEFYFDVDGWQQQLAEQGGSINGPDESRKRKRPTKKDLERFKEQKKAKKVAKTAWLRT